MSHTMLSCDWRVLESSTHGTSDYYLDQLLLRKNLISDSARRVFLDRAASAGGE